MLFIDARHIYRQVDRAHREWTPAQIGFIAGLVAVPWRDIDLTLGGKDSSAKIDEVFGKKPKYADISGLCKAAWWPELKSRFGRSILAGMSGWLLKIDQR